MIKSNGSGKNAPSEFAVPLSNTSSKEPSGNSFGREDVERAIETKNTDHADILSGGGNLPALNLSPTGQHVDGQAGKTGTALFPAI